MNCALDGKLTIALMRQRTPEWAPLDKSAPTIIWISHKKGNIISISPEKVAGIVLQKSLIEIYNLTE